MSPRSSTLPMYLHHAMLRMLRLFTVAFFETLVRRARQGPRRPSWPFVFEWTIRYLRKDWDDTAAWPIPVLRADMERRPYPKGLAGKVQLVDETLGGVPVRRFDPKGDRAPGVILYLHGGSFMYGSCHSAYLDLLSRLTVATNMRLLGLEYRLAPEHPYPAQREDALAAWDALVASGVSPEQIVVAGDSAGGNLALCLVLTLRDRKSPLPGALVLLSPWGDLTMPGASFQENADFDFGERDTLVKHAGLYAGTASLTDPQVSPFFAALHGLPRTMVVVGTAEIPRDDIRALATKVRDAGVDVTEHVAPDMPHNALFFAAYHPSGKAAFDAVVDFISGTRAFHGRPDFTNTSP